MVVVTVRHSEAVEGDVAGQLRETIERQAKEVCVGVAHGR